MSDGIRNGIDLKCDAEGLPCTDITYIRTVVGGKLLPHGDAELRPRLLVFWRPAFPPMVVDKSPEFRRDGGKGVVIELGVKVKEIGYVSCLSGE